MLLILEEKNILKNEKCEIFREKLNDLLRSEFPMREINRIKTEDKIIYDLDMM